MVADHGYDTGFAYHIVRLLLEVEQILVENDLELDRHGAMLKTIKRGEWTKERVINFANEKSIHLETLYNKSSLRDTPNVELVKDILINCWLLPGMH